MFEETDRLQDQLAENSYVRIGTVNTPDTNPVATANPAKSLCPSVAMIKRGGVQAACKCCCTRLVNQAAIAPPGPSQ